MAELIRKYNPEKPGKRYDTRRQKLLADILSLCYGGYFSLEVNIHPNTPKKGPALVLMGHLSLLEGAAFVADPYRPRTIPVVKQELYDHPRAGWALRQWGAIPARRDGQDLTAVRKIFRALDSGRVVCLAPAGETSGKGRPGPLQPVAVELALKVSLNMPVIPAAVVGAYEAGWFPGSSKLSFVTGEPMNLDAYNSKTPRHNQLEAAAREIQDAIARLYPPRNRPLPGAPVLAQLKR